jgi:hypothetical protein
MGNRVRYCIAILGLVWGNWSSPAQAQLFFEADAIVLGRNNQGGSNLVSGSQSLSTSQGSYGAEPGYRVGLGGVFDNWQVDSSFTQISPWSTSSAGTFGGAVYFDSMPSTGPNVLSFDSVLQGAATNAFYGQDASNEFLQGGTSFSTYSNSNYRDAEINIGSSQMNRPWRLAAGYRNIQLDEKNGMFLSGVFDSTGTGLSDNAITSTGATLISGDPDGFDAAGALNGTDTIRYSLDAQSKNELNGFQTTFGYRFLDGDWVTLEGIAKAGIYRNRMSGQVAETVAGAGNDDSVYQRILGDHKTAAAFAGNLGLRAIVGLTDYIDLVGGVEVLFLSGVALGPDQVGGVSQNAAGNYVYRVDNHGSIVAYGGTLGLRIFW